MMRAEYDSEADALSIDLVEIEAGTTVRGEGVNESCTVAVAGGQPVHVELLAPGERLELLDQVAERYELDHEALQAAARSALAAPDRVVELAVRTRASA